jgi:4-amino-4-deoxy-L-arabinose transferase-like glycosyltransferase
MLQRGDWVTPYFNGAPRFDKPILFYWLLLGSYAVFGVTEFAVRFWSALSGVGLVVLTAWAARRWFGPPADRWAGVSLATCLLTALLARAAVTDMLLTLFLTGSILAGAAALAGSPGSGRRFATAAWGAAALAVLVKGPIGLLIPGVTFALALAVHRELRSGLRRLLPWQGPALFLLLALPWYLLVLQANGWAFIEGFVIKHHLIRYTGVVSSHAGPFWFYIPVLLVGFFPWSGYLPTACWRVWGILRGRAGAGESGRFATVCAIWAGVVVALFSFAGTKLPSYVFPAFPALALLVGGLGISRPAAEWVGEPPSWIVRLGEGTIGAIGFLLASGLAAVPLYFDRLAPLARGVLDGVPAPVGPAVGLAGLLAAGSLLGLLAGRFRPFALAGMMAGVILVAAMVIAPGAHRILQGALREFSETARREIPPGGRVVAYGLNAPTIVFYSERRVLPVGAGSPEGPAQIRRRVEAGEPVLVIARSAHAPILDRVPGLARRRAQGGYVLYESLPR